MGRLLLPFLLLTAYPEASAAFPPRNAANEIKKAPAILQQRRSMTVTGKVIGKENGQPVPFVNIMLKEKGASGIIDYTLTGDDGAYTLKYGGNADSVMVTVSGFNITEKSVMLPFGDTEYNFIVSTGALELKEVRVSYEPVKRRSDTISYKVESFISGADRNIGDVLRKMPGIEVKTSGKILYNGKEIDRFYIEGMDMLRSRYGVATNTVKAGDVEFVEVLENNQHIKALADRKLDGKTALNLKLKESSKGTWGGTATVGAGYRPFLWNAEAAALFFGRRFQSINTYKTNNEGLDVSKENFDKEATSPLLDGVSSPAGPPIDENRYLKNNIHSVSLNTITKLDNKNFLRADVQYAHDERSAEGKSERLYHFPDGTGMEITELISNSLVDNKVSAGIDFESNSEKKYIKEQFSFSGLWNSDRGRVLNGGQDIMQKFSFPDINAENNVSGFFNRERWRWSFNSTTGYSSRPAVFRTSPLVTDGIFGETSDAAATGAVQDFKSSEFYTSNSAGTSYRLERWYFHVNASLNFRTGGFTSALTPLYGDSGTSGSGSTAAPGFSNNIRM